MHYRKSEALSLLPHEICIISGERGGLSRNILIHPTCLGAYITVALSVSDDNHYLNNRAFLSRNYGLIFSLQKFDVLTTNICLTSDQASRGTYASFKNIKFPRGNYQSDSSATLTLYCLYCSPLNFLLCTSSKIILTYFQFFSMKAV